MKPKTLLSCLLLSWNRSNTGLVTLPIEKKVMLDDIHACFMIPVPVWCWSRPVEAVQSLSMVFYDQDMHIFKLPIEKKFMFMIPVSVWCWSKPVEACWGRTKPVILCHNEQIWKLGIWYYAQPNLLIWTSFYKAEMSRFENLPLKMNENEISIICKLLLMQFAILTNLLPTSTATGSSAY